MQQFDITLKNEKVVFYQRISWLIIVINLILLLYLGIFSSEKNIRSGSIATLICCALVFTFFLYFRKTKYAFGLLPFFFFILMGFIGIGYYLLAGIALFFQLLHITATRQKIVTLTKEKISYPSFPVRNIQWNNLNNVLLKDGLLTIDHKNDKIIQQIIDEEKTKINETEFNEFCRIQLTRNDHGNNKPDNSGAVQGLAEGISIITGA